MRLSTRQLDVLEGIAEGLTIDQMSQLHFISPHTTKRHVSDLYEKLGVHDRGGAVAQGFRLGFLE